MSAFMKFIIGFTIFLGLGWLGIHSKLSDAWPVGSSAKYIENKLEENASSALVENGLHQLKVKMYGQRAVLGGKVASEDAKDLAIKIVLQSTGAGGIFRGGVTGVNADNLQIIAPINNPYWNASFDDEGRLVLSGYINSEQTRDQILAQAASLFDEPAQDVMEIVPGALADALPQMLTVLELASQLQRPAIMLQNGKFVIKGLAASRKLAEDIAIEAEQLSGFFLVNADISFPPAVANEFGVIVEDGPINDIGACQDLFQQSLSKNQILFSSAKAEIGSESFAFLDFLSTLAEQCNAFSLRVEGHTDATGDPVFNDYLSTQRAKAVVDYMINQGRSASQFSFSGYGSKKPVCVERTRACRARNRRIEITVGNKE